MGNCIPIKKKPNIDVEDNINGNRCFNSDKFKCPSNCYSNCCLKIYRSRSQTKLDRK